MTAATKPRTRAKTRPDDAFADILRDAVLSSDKTLYRLSMDTGIGQDQLSRFVRQERGLSLETAGVLAVALGFQLKRG
jgi:plasmid maintenance system antidote protein VapI